MNTPILKIAERFSTTPGPRYKKLGAFSGEEFREKTLIPWLEEHKSAKELTVNLDGATAYPPAFLEESFGGAVRKGYSLENITYICNDEPELIQEIKEYVDCEVFGRGAMVY